MLSDYGLSICCKAMPGGLCTEQEKKTPIPSCPQPAASSQLYWTAVPRNPLFGNCRVSYNVVYASNHEPPQYSAKKGAIRYTSLQTLPGDITARGQRRQRFFSREDEDLGAAKPMDRARHRERRLRRLQRRVCQIVRSSSRRARDGLARIAC